MTITTSCGETRWTGTVSRQLATSHHIVYSGKMDDQHERGVVLVMDKETHRSMIEWKPVNERLISARIKSSYVKLSVTVCYAPTEEAEDTEKEASYDKLQKLTEKPPPTHDVLLVFVGQINTAREFIMGRPSKWSHQR